MSATESNPVGPTDFSEEAPADWSAVAPPGAKVHTGEDLRYGARPSSRTDVPERNFLSAVRLEAGVTQEQIAEILGLTASAVSQALAPGKDLRLSTVAKYIDAMGGTASIVINLPNDTQMEVIL